MNTTTNLIALSIALASALLGKPKTEILNSSCTGELEIVTRVETRDNATGCSTCEMLRQGMLNGLVPAIYHPACGIPGPRREATERWFITNVVALERYTVLSQVLGELRTNSWTVERTLASTTNHQVLTSAWGPAPTNQLPSGLILWNGGVVSNLITSSNITIQVWTNSFKSIEVEPLADSLSIDVEALKKLFFGPAKTNQSK